MRLTFSAAARAELQEAVSFYEARRPGLGVEFSSEVKNAAARILQNPAAWAKLTPNARRYRVQRFPYALVYEIKAERVRILAVMHVRREPGYWLHRTDA